jgi:hypothetical protein
MEGGSCHAEYSRSQQGTGSTIIVQVRSIT